MSAAALILSRPRDYPLALRCAATYAAAGVRPHILTDPSEWPDGVPQGTVTAPYAPRGLMLGNDCHEAILAALLSLDAPVLIKTDCDAALSPAVILWLASATDTARTLSSSAGRNVWGGVWSAPREQVEAVARVAPSIPRCQCAESHLSICGLRAHGGILSGPTVAVWVPGRPASPAMTLPRRCSFPGRLLCGLAMFDTPPAMTCL